MYIKNAKINTEVLTSKFNKISLPRTTETVGIGVNLKFEYLILFDIEPFNIDILFEVEVDSERLTNNERRNILEEGLHICRQCPYYGEQNAYFNEGYYNKIYHDVSELKSISELVVLIKELIPFNYNFNECLSDLYSILYNIEYRIPKIECYTAYEEDLVNICYHFLNYVQGDLINNINERLELLEIYPNNLLLDLPENKYEVFENLQISIDSLKECIIPTKYIWFSDCIKLLRTSIKYYINNLEDNLYELIESIGVEESCPGIMEYIPGECLEYNVTNIPRELSAALEIQHEDFELEVKEANNINSKISLKIPAHYYTINLGTGEISIYADVVVNKDNNLIFYPLNFPNLFSDGNICFKKNNNTVIDLAEYGKFTHILELFWNSPFNHDLGFNDIQLNRNTQKYQDALENMLDQIFNIHPEKKDYINLDNLTYCRNNKNIEDKDNWEWFDTSIYDLYIKVGFILILLVIERSTNIIHKVIKIGEIETDKIFGGALT